MLMNILKEPYLDMVFSSSMGLGEIGSQKTCEGDLGEYGAHAILTINTTNLPLYIRFGMCLPVECKQESYENISRSVSNLVNNLYSNFYSEFKVDTPFTNSITKVTIKIERIKEVH